MGVLSVLSQQISQPVHMPSHQYARSVTQSQREAGRECNSSQAVRAILPKVSTRTQDMQPRNNSLSPSQNKPGQPGQVSKRCCPTQTERVEHWCCYQSQHTSAANTHAQSSATLTPTVAASLAVCLYTAPSMCCPQRQLTTFGKKNHYLAADMRHQPTKRRGCSSNAAQEVHFSKSLSYSHTHVIMSHTLWGK